MILTLLVQVLLPLLFLAWLAFLPAVGWLAWSLQVLAIASVLFGMTLAMLWAMPPYWTPYLYWLLLVSIVGSQLWRGIVDGSVLWGAGVLHSITLLILFAIGLLGCYLGITALQGRQLPDEQVVDIAAPFPSGDYLIAHGGSTETVNVHLKTLNPDVQRFNDYHGQSRALDIFRITSWGASCPRSSAGGS